MTKYKIVSFLAVSPFTFEQLWRVSRIHRNTLRKNLDLLVEEETVSVHKYAIPYTEEFYGYMYKYAIPYMTPLYGYKYYLLDCSKRQSDGYMNFYYNNKAREKREPFNEFFIKERQKHQKKLCVNDEIKAFKIKSELQMKEMTRTEFDDYWREAMEFTICVERLMREAEIIAVKFGERFSDEEQTIRERDLNSATKIAEFFSKKGYSLLDVLIRCCTERTTISTTGFFSKDLDLPLIRYRLLWKIMEKAGLLKN